LPIRILDGDIDDAGGFRRRYRLNLSGALDLHGHRGRASELYSRPGLEVAARNGYRVPSGRGTRIG